MGKHSFPWCFVHPCWRVMVGSDWGDMKRYLDPHFAKAICCTRPARCKYKTITFNFSSGQCTTLFCTWLVCSWQKKDGFGSGRCAGHSVHCGDRSKQVQPIACIVQPLSLLDLSQQDPSAGSGPPEQDGAMACFNTTPYPTSHTTVGAGSETSVPQR